MATADTVESPIGKLEQLAAKDISGLKFPLTDRLVGRFLGSRREAKLAGYGEELTSCGLRPNG